MENLKATNEFLLAWNILKINKDKRKNLNMSIPNTEMELVIQKNL